MAITSTAMPQTVQQRAVAATSHLRTVLGLDDLKLLSVALAEAASVEAGRNPEFARHIRAIYEELAAAKRRTTTRKQKVEDIKLVPVNPGQARVFDPAAPLDPYFLSDLYGPHQLRLALSRYSLPRLKEGLNTVQAKNPGTKPQSKARKDSIIDYIVEHVAGPGY